MTVSVMRRIFGESAGRAKFGLGTRLSHNKFKDVIHQLFLVKSITSEMLLKSATESQPRWVH